MSAHPDPLDLSAYLDGELPAAERGELKRHLQACAACRGEVTALEKVKSALAAGPRRRLPAAVSAAWEARLRPSPWRERVGAFLFLPQVWAPALTAALVLILAKAERPARQRAEAIPIETLAAAHSRYEAEGLVPGGDPTAANFSSELGSLHETD